MLVRTQLGHSTDTPTWLPSASSSNFNVSLSATTAALDALYGPIRGRWYRPEIDAVFTMWPTSLARRWGRKARRPWITPKRFTPITHSKSSQRELGDGKAAAADTGVVAQQVDVAEPLEGGARPTPARRPPRWCRSGRPARRRPARPGPRRPVAARGARCRRARASCPRPRSGAPWRTRCRRPPPVMTATRPASSSTTVRRAGGRRSAGALGVLLQLLGGARCSGCARPRARRRSLARPSAT